MNIIDKLNQHFALNAEVKDGIISGSGSNADEIKILSMPLHKDRLFVRELLKGTDFCCLTEYILTGTESKVQCSTYQSWNKTNDSHNACCGDDNDNDNDNGCNSSFRWVNCKTLNCHRNVFKYIRIDLNKNSR